MELEKGVKYYAELIHREGTGGSFINVSWERPDGVRETVPGVALAPFGSTFDPFNPAAATEIVEQPMGVSVSESEEAMFWATVHAPQPTAFQWLENGQPIDGAILSWYSIPEAQLTQNGNSYTVRITDGNGQTATSSAATLTVGPDSTAPTVVSVQGSGNPHGIIVQYSEKVTEASATNASNYVLSGQSLTVASVIMLSVSSVLLDVGEFTDDPISLRISGVRDRTSSANTIATTDVAVVFSPPGASYLFYEFTGGGLGGFYPAPRGVGQYPENFNPFDPSVKGNAGEGYAGRVSSSTPYLEVPNSGDIDTAPGSDIINDYALVIFGYLVPQQTANYYFYIASDDNSELYLSTDENPANTSLIAREPQWNGVREWNGTADVDTTAEDETNINHSDAVSLQAGQRYYFEVVSQEGSGGDNVAVAWNTSGNPPANGDPPISGEFLQQAIETGPLTITSQPADQMVVEGDPAVFSVAVEGSDALAVAYQWYRDGQPIIGATTSEYSLDPVQLSDNGAVLHVEAFNDNGTFNKAVSNNASIIVETDFFAPKTELLSAGSSLFAVAIQFDEPVDLTDATFSIDGGISVNSATLTSDLTTVVLETSEQTPGAGYTLTFEGVSDISGNRNATGVVTLPFSAFEPRDTSALTGSDIGEVGGTAANAPASPGSSTIDPDGNIAIMADGGDIWGNNDGAYYLHEQIQGDFDIAVRVVSLTDGVNEWSKAGLMARESLEPGSPHVLNAVTPAAGTNASTLQERVTADGDSTEPGGAGARVPNPAYPNAWIRLKRQGDVFTAYVSEDGAVWNSNGQTVRAGLPETLYVGMIVTSHLIGSQVTAVFDPSSYGEPSVIEIGSGPDEEPATLNISRDGNEVTVSWDPDTGGLMSAPSVTGPWEEEAGAASPHAATIEAGNKFYRVAQ